MTQIDTNEEKNFALISFLFLTICAICGRLSSLRLSVSAV
jgi:hypothetical protein